VVVPPGVDTERFRQLSDDERLAARARFGVAAGVPLIVSVSRLVPRKGMDTLIRASAELAFRLPDLQVLIAGGGRDQRRLARLIARTRAPARLIGRIADDALPELHGCADVFAMLCRNRWLGLEQEGFGIVFLEAAACGVPQVAGRSGGSHEAVEDGVTGFVIGSERPVGAATEALARILGDRELRTRMSTAARRRAVDEFTYDKLARELQAAIDAVGDRR
jgi:phosphatidylinositol alpha-1,6-mannosyltransferase